MHFRASYCLSIYCLGGFFFFLILPLVDVEGLRILGLRVLRKKVVAKPTYSSPIISFRLFILCSIWPWTCADHELHSCLSRLLPRSLTFSITWVRALPFQMHLTAEGSEEV